MEENQEQPQENQEQVPEQPPFDFSVEKVEQAATSVKTQANDVQFAIEYLQGWEANQQSIFQACQVISTSENLNAHFFSALVLDHNIPHIWGMINDIDCTKIRTFILEQIYKYGENVYISAALARAIAHIAVFDYPEKWSEFEVYLLTSEDNIVSFLILEAFFTDIENSQYITGHRKQQLRNTFKPQLGNFIPRIGKALNTPEMAIYAISAFNAMAKWAPRFVITPDFIETFFCTFLTQSDDNIIKITITCLKTIFLKRTDSRELFDRYRHSILEYLATLKLPTGQSITVIPLILRFAISLFYQYMMPIEKMVIHSEPKYNDYLHFLISTTLSIREDIPKKLWSMWYAIFVRIFSQNLDQMPLKYSTQLFMPMIADIVQNLYEMLPLSIESDGILLPEAQNCFAKLIEIDFQFIKGFLEQQNPSPSLSYALGCLISVRVSRQDMTIFVQIVDNLFRACNEDDTDYILALMYGFSRSSSFLSSLGHFGKFLEIVINCLQNSSAIVSEAASHALLYISERYPSLFIQDEAKIILDQLIQMSEHYLKNLSDASAIRMFECLTIINVQLNNREKLAELYSPLVNSLQHPEAGAEFRKTLYIISQMGDATVHANVPLQSTDQNLEIDTTADIEGAPQITIVYGKELQPFVLAIVFDLAKNIIVRQDSPIEVIDLLLSALSPLVINIDEYQQAIDDIRTVLALFHERQQVLPCLFTFIASIRSKFKSDMNELFPSILESFVFPIIPPDGSSVPEDAPLAEIFRMIASFEYAPVDVEWIVKVCLGQGLVSFDPEVNKSAAKVVKRVFREMPTVALRELFGAIGVQIFISIFLALSDSMHKQSSSALIKLFFNILRLLMDGPQFPDELKDFIMRALNEVFQNNENQLFEQFLDFIIRSLSSSPNEIPKFSQFEDGVVNFLIMQNKYSPGDAAEFNIYKSPISFFF